jgi:ABC-type sugar transport system ATPase subunit
VGRTVALLSGGNQQKVLFAKGLALDVDLYVLDEPTVGVDVGTRSSLYALIKRLCEAGAGVVVISSDLPEVLALGDRILVMREGRQMGIIDSARATQEGIMAVATGQSEAA